MQRNALYVSIWPVRVMAAHGVALKDQAVSFRLKWVCVEEFNERHWRDLEIWTQVNRVLSEKFHSGRKRDWGPGDDFVRPKCVRKLRKVKVDPRLHE